MSPASPAAPRAAQGAPGNTASDRLRPYVPRLVVDWLRETPDRTYRQVEGSLAFVDVSGFTNLTERLSRRGKVGAEEMNQILNDCFTECLTSAYDFGAGVIKWGGDAVLLLFDGEQHERRACRAAFEMQGTMRRVGRIRTDSGAVTLRMSIGVHSGLLDFFLVGDLHRELVVAGPAATRTVAMESIADAGEIAVSPETAAALEPGDLGPKKDAAILLRRGPRVDTVRGASVDDVEALDLAECIPVSVREHLLAGEVDPEHRLLTAAFIHVMGVDDLLGRDGPEEVAGALATTLSAIERTGLEYGVSFFDTDIYVGGGKLMLMAGAPASTGADEERMLRAMRAVLDGGLPLTLRIGVTRGRIFVGDFGPAYRRTYTVTGDSVNLAARLMARAEPGQILVANDVVERSRTRFDVSALEPFTVKGKAEPVHAYALGRALGAAAVETERAPLVGRDQELAVLLAGLESLRAGSSVLVDLVGEPGLGKSRLVEELRARAGEIRTLSVECDEYASSTAYGVFGIVLHELLELADDAPPAEAEAALLACVASTAPHLAPWLPLLGTPLGLELAETAETALLDERFRRERVHEVTAELLGMLLLEPTVLAFEDAHWMDDASAELLRHLAAQLELRPWMIVVTRREQDSGFLPADGSGAVRIDLLPLRPEQASALLQATTEEMPLLPHELEALAERSGGNPLFLAELLAAARQAGGIESLPDSVESLLMAQIDRLSPADRRLLRSAAVLGAVFSPGLLADALGEAVDGAAWLRLGDFLHEQGDGTFRFRHALVRDAAYEGLSYRRRRELHSTVGLTIERDARKRGDDDAELLSLHFFYAHELEKAWHYSRTAGERAAAIYANVEAASFFERALAAARAHGIESDERVALLEALGDVRFRLGEFESGGVAFRHARGLLPSRSVESARLRLKEALVPYRLGRYPRALAALTVSLRRLEGVAGDAAEAQRARLLVYRGIIRYRQGKTAEAIHWLRLAVASAERSDAREALAQAYQNLDLAHLQRGDLDSAVFGRRALALFEELGNLTQQAGVLNNLAILAHERGRWTESLELFGQASSMWESAGDAWSASFATYNRGEILADLGRLDEAEALLRKALRVWRASGAGPEAAEAMRQLGRVLARKRQAEEALELLETARRDQVEYGEAAEALLTGARIAEALAIAGRPGESLTLSTRLLAETGSVEAPPATVALLERVRGWSLTLLGRPIDARAALEAALGSARERGADYEVALALGLLDILEADPALARERDGIMERLGVQAAADPPLL
jgi:class 3 adenylate cyclase/tetratricopeptide (TPR) repeat protein